ncbi:hypothetical protein AAHA92_32863 [Salvia divinorum]|uniref:Uncharacterized protein n=1 Tax=Salvia divinorum TaxID=28513 RepID=A0ABD1FM51_SALDI
MAETHSEGGGEGGVGPSYSKPDGDLLSMMTQIWADLKEELRSKVDGLQSDMNGVRGDVKASKIRMQTLHNTLFEEVNALKKGRPSRPPTPRGVRCPMKSRRKGIRASM